MSKLSPEDVRHVARLAALRLSSDEAEALGRDLHAILDYVEQLAEVDTEGVPPTAHAIPFETPLRQDTPVSSIDPEEVLAQAPARAGTAFAVPKVLDEA